MEITRQQHCVLFRYFTQHLQLENDYYEPTEEEKKNTHSPEPEQIEALCAINSAFEITK